jgi:hypothetical protein
MNYIFTLNNKGIDFCYANKIMTELVKSPSGESFEVAIINKDVEMLGAPIVCSSDY